MGGANETVAQEAERLVNGDRQASYSHPYNDFSRTATLWSAILGTPVSPRQVAMCMVGVKLSRECHQHKRDNVVDAIGYLCCLDKVIEREAELAETEDEALAKNFENVYTNCAT